MSLDAKVADRVKESTVTVGTGALALGGPVAGFMSFLLGIGDTQFCYYTIQHRTIPGEYEVGRGQVTGGGATLTRGAPIYSSSNAGALVNFSAGTKDVFVTIPAAVIGQLATLDGKCRLDVASSTSVKLTPFNGNTVPIKSGGVWQARAIPAAGITKINTGIPASTVSYVYAADVAGAVALEFSTTGHAPDAETGVEVKTGDATRTLVGMVWAHSDGSFDATGQWISVVSWFQRRLKVGIMFRTATLTLPAAGALTLLNDGPLFVTWATVAVTLTMSVFGVHNNPGGAGSAMITGLGLDGAALAGTLQYAQPNAGGAYTPTAGTRLVLPAEGKHQMSMFGRAVGTEGQWVGNAAPEDMSLGVTVWG